MVSPGRNDRPAAEARRAVQDTPTTVVHLLVNLRILVVHSLWAVI